MIDQKQSFRYKIKSQAKRAFRLLKKMKELFPTILFIFSVLCILCVGFYPQLCILLYPAFIGLFISLFLCNYDIVKMKKQATIKAYYKTDSLLHRYFGHFFLAKVISLGIAFIGGLPLFLMLIFPSGSEILIFCLLVPCSIYCFKLSYSLFYANFNVDFAPILAKKYTALIIAFFATIIAIVLNDFAPSIPHDTNISTYYQTLLQKYNITQMPCQILKELFGFLLLKKALFDIFFNHITDTYLHIALNILFAFGYFASFASFALLCIGLPKTNKNLQTDNIASQANEQHNLTQSRFFRQFFAMLFFLIFLYIAFNISIHLQPLAKKQSFPPLLSSHLLSKNEQYIQIYMEGIESFIRANDLLFLKKKIEENIADFEKELNNDINQSVDTYLTHKERIIDEYSKWYFSISGEYTRLFYAAIGKGKDIAQEQFSFLLKAHTPYDLQAHINGIYDEHFKNLKNRLRQTIGLFQTQQNPHNRSIYQVISLDNLPQKLDLLSPRASDGVAAILSTSVIGAMILKTSSKALAKTSAKVVAKSAAKKSLGGAVGATGSLLCGGFAPLCAIGFFIASDYAINSADEIINQDSFKQQMHEGFTSWELQLKNSLTSYNLEISEQILESLKLFEEKRQKEHE